MIANGVDFNSFQSLGLILEMIHYPTPMDAAVARSGNAKVLSGCKQFSCEYYRGVLFWFDTNK